MPMTPARIWQAIQDAKGVQSACGQIFCPGRACPGHSHSQEATPCLSRMTQSSGVSDSTSSEYAFPLTVSEIIKPSLFLHGPGTNQLPAFTHKGLTLRIAASLHTRALVSGGFLRWF